MTDNNSNPQGNRNGSNGIDFAAMLNGLLATGNSLRLVLRHRGETVLRLPLTVVAIAVLILLWQSAFLLVGLVALVFFTQTQVSFERRRDVQQPPPYRD